jgi:methionyl-tRNA formyltransferase
VSIQPGWWNKPRRISVVVDNPSWILPFAERLVSEFCADGDDAALFREYASVPDGVIAFFLGCIHIAGPEILARNRRNLIVHESELPEGRGFSPLTWQILEGKKRVGICLLEAVEQVDAGPVIYRDWLNFAGHELIDELHGQQGEKTIELCRRFVAEPVPLAGERQSAQSTFYPRRTPVDSRIDTNRSVADQFDLLRVVDNERHPAWFEHRGRRYKLAIQKVSN